MQAVILAAGMGKRLGSLTEKDTKCMVSVLGKRLIDRTLEALAVQKKEGTPISRIVMVVGFGRERLREYLGEEFEGIPILYIENEEYNITNNIWSLWKARDLFAEEDTLLFESDLIFETKTVRKLINNPYPDVVLVAPYKSFMNGTVVTIDHNSYITEFIPKSLFDRAEVENYYKTVNIYKFSREFINKCYIPFLNTYVEVMGKNEYYEEVLRILVSINHRLKVEIIEEDKWYEIDTQDDLRQAEFLFGNPSDRYDHVMADYGGYWRYEGLIDFCYLVNPWYPCEEFKEEIKNNASRLMSGYPSGLRVQKRAAANLFGCDPDEITVGNGAAELIGPILSSSKAPFGVVKPVFNEYPARCPGEILYHTASIDDLGYSTEDLLSLFSRCETLVVVNPDNPSGHFIPYVEMERLLQLAREEKKRLIVDESFIDFVENDKKYTLIRRDILDKYPEIIVVKSISKSYGVPGLRLGVLVSGNRNLIAETEKGLSIWNINSMGQYFLEEAPHYKESYWDSCNRVAKERRRLTERLERLPGIKPLSSQANYVTCRLLNGTARDLAVTLFDRANLLIKDLAGKAGIADNREFFRVAVRNEEDNDILLNALENYLHDQSK
jgi:histidinol-phosphate/aromatic aminotransferase/cobyric acid decarboxylase-like protein/choline kinase